jgi:hypothetical protein
VVFYLSWYLGFLVALYLEITNFVVGMLTVVVLLVTALPLEIVLGRRGLISWRATFPHNSKMRKALVIAPVILVAIVMFGRLPSTAPRDMISDLSWLTAVGALFLFATAVRGRLMPPDGEAPKRA